MEWHEKEMRQVYAETLIELAQQNPDIVVMEADLAKASGTPPFAKHFPDRFVDCGVAEANMIGVAAGLATVGKIPFCATFTPFATRRVYDQVTISVAYARQNVKIVGTAPGITAGSNGGTHMCFQDLAIMRAMPGMTILSPCDAYELRAALRWMAAEKGPMYLQLIRSREPRIFADEYAFAGGKAVLLSQGLNATIVTTGYTTKLGIDAAQQLRAKALQVDHLHFPTIKPFDAQSLVQSARKTGFVVTVENQNTIGGLGGAVCEVLSEALPTKVKRLGIPDAFGEVATEEYLYSKHGFGVEQIISTVERRGT